MGHEFLRPPLTIMHFFVSGMLTDEQINKFNSEYNVFINNPSKRSQLSDIFTGMHFGIYESGAELDRETVRAMLLSLMVILFLLWDKKL